jgi:hypothetical protein
MIVNHFEIGSLIMRYTPTAATFLVGLFTWTLSSLSASAATLFLEDFNSFSTAASFFEGEIIPSTVGSGFRVVQGSIDIRDETVRFGLNTGRKNVADLNGFDPSFLTSVETFNLTPGTVTLSFDLAGSQRGDTNPVIVSLGTLYSESFTLRSNAPFRTITRTFDVSLPTTANLVFDSRRSGNDLSGLLLDNVVLATPDVTVSIPENTSPLAIFISFFMGAWMFTKGNRKLTQNNKVI